MSLLQSEFSVRLVGSPAEVTAYRASLRGAGAARGRWSRDATRFFDTKDRDLLARGIELALRETEGATLEEFRLVGDPAFPLIRRSLTRALPEGAQVGRATGAPEIDAHLLRYQNDLTEVASLAVESWSALISEPDLVMEVVVLQGALRVKGAARPVSEIRFDLLRGSREAFFDIIENAVADARGKLRLAAPADFLAKAFRAKARKMSLAAEDSAADVLAAGLGATAARLMEIAPYLTQQRSAEAARQLRVALRRFRTLERVFRSDLKRKTFLRSVDRAREVGRSIGEARDWEIFLSETMTAQEVENYEPRGARIVSDLGREKRGDAWDCAVAAVESEPFSLLLLDLLRGAYCQPWRAGAPQLEAPISGFAEAALDRRLAKADAIASAIDPDQPETQHELRLALKKLRYTAQMFRDLFDKPARKPYFAAMSRLQEKFGILNDAVVAQERCADLSILAHEDETIDANGAAARTLGFILGWRSAAANDASLNLAAEWREFWLETPFWRLPHPSPPDYIDLNDDAAQEPVGDADESENQSDAENTDHSLP